MSIRSAGAAILALTLTLGCAGDADDEETIALDDGVDTAGVTVAWPEGPELTAEEIERGRLDMSWRRVAEEGGPSPGLDGRDPTAPDSAALAPGAPADREPLAGPAAPVRVRADTVAFPEEYADLGRIAPDGSTASSRDTIDLPPVELPLHGDVQGPSVMRVQVLLDRSPFSPGILDGKWGKNTEKAIWWLQSREGLETTGVVDSTTFQRLYALAGRPDRYVRTVALTADDVAGPFVQVPGDIYAQAELDCLCYESTREKVAERYHSDPELLARLNPGVDLAALSAGDTLKVPNVEKTPLAHDMSGPASRSGPERTVATPAPDTLRSPSDTTRRPAATADRSPGEIARIVISGEGFYVHAVDADGRIVHHFPTTLGSEYAPSPEGEYSIASIAFAPWFHWKPDLLTGEDPSDPDARLPPGPNSPVGLVWMQLSKPHYGIHGTSAPATIGYVTSHGCVRLTNWDAVLLASRVAAGVPVEFRDVAGRSGTVAIR